MTTRSDCRAPARGPDVPTTVLLGRRWAAASRRSIDRVARRLAGQLGHDVEACDLEAPGEPLRLVARRAAARGAMHLVLLPLALDDPARRDRRGVDAVTTAVAPWPFLRLHRGRPPAADDVARMLGDHARAAASSLPGGQRNLADVVVVIASWRRRQSDRQRGGSEARSSHLRGASVRGRRLRLRRPHDTEHPGGHRAVGAARRSRDRRGAASSLRSGHVPARRPAGKGRRRRAGIEVAVARSLEAHPALSWALVRRHLEALSDATVLPGIGAPWVNPELLQVLQHAHGHSPGMGAEWQARIAAILPPRYQEPGLTVSSAPMGAASLQRDAEGRVAWDEMWQGFCELGLAGGPPHRGTLLEAVAPDEARANPSRYDEVRAELARGLRMVTGLRVVLDGSPGWIGLACADEEMAIWLMRAIVVENVMVRRERAVLFLPAGPRLHPGRRDQERGDGRGQDVPLLDPASGGSGIRPLTASRVTVPVGAPSGRSRAGGHVADDRRARRRGSWRWPP